MGQRGLITTSISQHYSHLYTIMSSIFGGRWVVSLMLRGYWPLWWQPTCSPELKRCFGASIWVWKHLLPRNDLFYWVPYHITILPILRWWKGGGTFLWVCSPFVVLCFPMLWQEHRLCMVSQYSVNWIPQVHNRCKGLEILVSAS